MLKRIFGAESADAWQKRMAERTKEDGCDAKRTGSWLFEKCLILDDLGVPPF